MSALRDLAFAAACALACASASAAPISYAFTLAPELPGATGAGSGTLSIDTIASTLAIQVDFTGLSGAATVAHVHCCAASPGLTAGIAVSPPTLPSFPTGVSSGSYSQVLDLTDPALWVGAFVTASGGTLAGATERLAAGLANGSAYFNIHSSAFTAGEIRGFPTALVPAPASFALLGLGLLTLAGATRARRAR